ncbi:MAG: hypothetical protein ACRD9R_10220, partial [Pyrinomonadaceae bacterium]
RTARVQPRVERERSPGLYSGRPLSRTRRIVIINLPLRNIGKKAKGKSEDTRSSLLPFYL